MTNEGEARVIRSLEKVGMNGIEFISDTSPHLPGDGYVFGCVQVVAQAVFAEILPALTGNTFTGVTIPAGIIIYGRFTSIDLTSGSVLAYKSK